MKKKLIVTGIVIVIITILIFCYYYFAKKEKPYTSTVLNAIPTNASIIFDIHDFSKFYTDLKNNNQIWNELSIIPVFKDLNNNLILIDSLIIKYPYLKNSASKSLTITAHNTGVQKNDFLYLIPIQNNVMEEELKSFFTETINEKGIISTRNYDNSEIYDVKFAGTIKDYSYSCALHKGVFIFSFSSILVEDAIRQLNTNESLSTDKHFNKVSSTAGKNVPANIYINYKHFPKLINLISNNTFSNDILSFNEFANWSELDLTLKSNSISLNGFTYSDLNSNNFLNIFQNQQAESFTLGTILPANTSCFISIASSNISDYYKNYCSYLDKSGLLMNQKAEITRINNKYGIDIESVFIKNIEKEIALAYSDINSLNVSQDAYAIFRVKSKSTAEENIQEMLKAICGKEKREFSSVINTCDIDNDLKYPIYELKINNIPNLLFGKIFRNINFNYLCLIDNYVVFGTSISSLSKIIHYNILQKTLSKDIYFNSYSEHLTSKSNFYFYCNINSSSGLISKFMDKHVANGFIENINAFQKIQSISYQISTSNDLFYSNIYLNYNQDYKEPPRTIWESHLDTLVKTKPKLVINHTNDEKEIIVQDYNNNLYLINNMGRILWKKAIDEEILSDVIQIDVFRNNKLQYIFNTKNKIYIVDRNGNNLDNFPIKLPYSATNPIGVFDYENNRDYRFFIACEDRKIRVYSKEGNIITGWEFEKTETTVRNEIQHFRIEDKDYIVVSDSLRTYILDRRGSLRVRVKKQFARSKNNVFSLFNATNEKKSRLVTTDTLGNVIFIDFDGNIEGKKYGNYSSEHYFECFDVNADNVKDMIFVDKNNLEVFKDNKKEIFSYQFDEDGISRPVFYQFSQKDRKIGVASTKTNEIFLFNSNGDIYDGFPLRGKTQFSIGYLNKNYDKFNLVVGSDLNFLYNYEIK